MASKPWKYKNRGVKRKLQDQQKWRWLAPDPVETPGGSSPSAAPPAPVDLATEEIASTNEPALPSAHVTPLTQIEIRRLLAAEAAERRAAAAAGWTSSTASDPATAPGPEAAPEAAPAPEGAAESSSSSSSAAASVAPGDGDAPAAEPPAKRRRVGKFTPEQ